MARPSRSEFTTRTRRLIEQIREDIAAGNLGPGDFLPSELELGRTFGLSKESVRKALDVLVEERLIVKIRRVGNRVAEVAASASLEANEKQPYPVTEVSDSPTAASVQADSVRKCETSSAGGKNSLVRFAFYPSLDAEACLQEAVAEFENKHPNISVQLIDTPFPLHFAEHGMADAVSISSWDALKLKEKDPAMALLADAPQTECTHPQLSLPFQASDGRLAAAPFLFSPVVLCSNLAHFQAAGLNEPEDDWTWYTLLKTARTLTAQLGVFGFATHMQSVNRWPVFLLQNGFRFRDGENRRASETPALWESLRIARDLIHKQGGNARLWTESDSDIERWFREGRASMIMTTYYGLNRLRGTDFEYSVSSLPSLRTSDTLQLVTGLAVNRLANEPEAASLLIQHLCGEEAQSSIRRRTLSLPAHPAALAIRSGLEGNRPVGEHVYTELWDRSKHYFDLQLDTGILEEIREQLKAYWSRLEDEAEASERLELLLGT